MTVPPAFRRKRTFIAAAVAIASVATPASSLASTTFGSPLDREPNALKKCPVEGTLCTRVGNLYPSLDPQHQVSPVDGVVVAFRIRSNTPDMVTFRLARVVQDGTAYLATAAGTGPSVTLQGTGAVEEYAARVSIKAGDSLALDSTETGATYGNSGGKRTLVYGPVLTDGQGPRDASDDDNNELLVAAVIEADADADGYGDETQDLCPTDARQQAACDVTGPAFATFVIGKPAFSVQTNAVIKVSENATLTLSIKKRVAKKGGGYTYVAVPAAGKIVRTATGGTKMAVALKRAFTGSKKLAVGRYQLVAVAVDDFGNTTTVAKAFRIVAPKKK